MSTTLLLIEDGRTEYLHQCLVSIEQQLPEFDEYVHVSDPDHELGFAGAIQAGWDQITTDFVFHVEQDFTFNWPVDLERMRRLLEQNPLIAQMALKRQPWNEQEKAAGGIVEQHPDDFYDCGEFTVHRRFFTTNPSLYKREIVEKGWPQVPQSEGIFTHQLATEGYWFAYLGGKFDPPAVTHIGEDRVGVGY